MARVLLTNAVAQVLVACLLGWYMLVPLQPWGTRFKTLPMKALLAAHLDFILLALTQLLAAAVEREAGLPSPRLVTGLLILGGWLNPLPYLFRGAGVDAFVLAGPTRQRLAAGLAGFSSVCLTVAWALVLIHLVKS
jgi:hypothetical protein